MRFFLKGIIKILHELACLPLLFFWALFCRYKKKKISIGLGPEPLINNIYHKKALQLYGYSAETYVVNVYFISSEFDIIIKNTLLSRILRSAYPAFLALLRYECLYIYFNGGPLINTTFLWRLEPLLFKFARMPIVIMPYGSDVQELTRTHNLLLRHSIIADYPSHRYSQKKIRGKIDLWSNWADHIIAGCDWVDYLFHWDTLLLAHFSIDFEKAAQFQSTVQRKTEPSSALRILHAPNHRNMKGTKFFIQAVEDLRSEGISVELILLERQPNDKILEAIASADVVADQLVIGWYAMFAIEAMAMGKPVLCYLRQDLVDLYAMSGIVHEDEIPIVRCDFKTVKTHIRKLAENRHLLPEIGDKSRLFAKKFHSIESIGSVFHRINQSLGINPNPDGDPRRARAQ